jgi:hypothetical protein
MKSKKIFLAFIILSIFLGCQKNRTVPEDLLGVWKTSAPKYADRSFEIKKDIIIFAIGEGKIDFYSITGVEKIREDDSILFTIFHENKEGQEFKLSFYHYPEKDGIIRFKNQKQIKWIKDKGSPD